MNRREFNLILSSVPFFNLGNGVYASNNDTKNENSVIWVWLGGGISQLESWIPKTEAPVEIRSINGAITTKSGYQIGANFPKLSTVSHLMSTIHSYSHKDANHHTSTAWQMTGVPNLGLAEGNQSKNASLGSIVSFAKGANRFDTGMPTYVKCDKISHDSNGYLPSTHTGFEASESGIKNLQINTSDKQFIRRLEMANDIESMSKINDNNLREWSNLRNQAANIIKGKAAQAFNLKNENEKTLLKYNVEKSRFGKSCLLAKRMIENNVKFVTIEHGGHDNHSDIKKAFESDRIAELDFHLTNLILDLESSGKLNSTLIVVATEFGRTYKLNNGNGLGAGRDHWNLLIPMLLCGPSQYHGKIIGECDKSASSPISTPFKPNDLAYTIFDWLGIQKDFRMIDVQKRPRFAVEGDARIII